MSNYTTQYWSLLTAWNAGSSCLPCLLLASWKLVEILYYMHRPLWVVAFRLLFCISHHSIKWSWGWLHVTSPSEYFCSTSMVLNTFWVWWLKEEVVQGRRKAWTVWQIVKLGHISYFNMYIFSHQMYSSSLQVTARGDLIFRFRKEKQILKQLRVELICLWDLDIVP